MKRQYHTHTHSNDAYEPTGIGNESQDICVSQAPNACDSTMSKAYLVVLYYYKSHPNNNNITSVLIHCFPFHG